MGTRADDLSSGLQLNSDISRIVELTNKGNADNIDYRACASTHRTQYQSAPRIDLTHHI
jgi:hypothetical protein